MTASVATDPVHEVDQALAPPVGLVEVYSLPVCVPATHRVVAGQVMAVMVPVETPVVLVHALVPPVGLVAVKTLPPAAMRTSVVMGTRPAWDLVTPSVVLVHALAPPVGLVETNIVPSSVVVATHSVVDGHEMLPSGSFVFTVSVADVHLAAPAAGWVEVQIWSPWTMTQSVVPSGTRSSWGRSWRCSGVVVQLSPGLVTDVVTDWPRALAMVVSVSPPGVVVVISVPPRGIPDPESE